MYNAFAVANIKDIAGLGGITESRLEVHVIPSCLGILSKLEVIGRQPKRFENPIPKLKQVSKRISDRISAQINSHLSISPSSRTSPFHEHR